MIISVTCVFAAILLGIARVYAAPRRGRDVSSWARVMGCVVGADIQRSWLPGLHRVRIAVAYTVDGQRRILERVHPTDTFSRAVARTLKHPIGSQATVSYNPARPDESVIAPRIRRHVPSQAFGDMVAG
jgi:hypothetical protein